MFEQISRWQALTISSTLLDIEAWTLAIISLALGLIEASRLSHSRDMPQAGQRPVRVLFSCVAILLGCAFSWGLGMDHLFLSVSLAVAFCLGCLRPVYAVALFIALYYLRPWEVVDNELLASVPRTVAVVAIARLLIDRVLRRDFRVAGGAGVAALCLLAGWLFLSTMKAPDPASAQAQFMDNFSKAVIVFLLIINSMRDAWDKAALRWTVVLASLGAGLVGLVYSGSRSAGIAGFGPEPVVERLTAFGLIGNANDIAAIMTLAFPLVFVPWLRRRTWGSTAFTAIACAVIATVIWESRSRGSAVSILLVLGLIAASYFKLRARTVVVMVSLLVVVGMASMSVGRSQSDLDQSTDSRLNYWVTSFRMAARNPAFGVGYSSFGRSYEAYAPSIEYEWGSRTAHSTWFLVLGEGGVPAFLFLIALFGSVLRSAWRMRGREPELLYAVLGYGVSISFLSHSYMIYPYILFALVLGAERIPPFRLSGMAAVLMSCVFLGAPQTARAEATLLAAEGGDKPVGSALPSLGGRLDLHGARGETVDFLLRISGASENERVLIEWKDAEAIRPSVEFYWMAPIRTTQPSFPGAFVGQHFDPLIPLPGGMLDGSRLHSGRDEWVWGEVEIPFGARAGLHEGTITLASGAAVPLTLEVWNLTMPAVPSFPAYAELTPYYLLLGHYGGWRETGEYELTRKYIAEMLKHRMVPLKAWLQRFHLAQAADGAYWDLDSPGPDSSVSSIYLKDFPAWPLLSLPPYDADRFDTSAEDYWRALGNSIRRWKLEERALVYLWDEPHSWEMPDLIEQAKWLKQASPTARILVTAPLSRDVMPYVDIIAPPLEKLVPGEFPPTQWYQEFRARGKQVWSYVSCMSHGCDKPREGGTPDFVLDRPAAWIRSIGWIGQRVGLDAFLYYSVDDAYQLNPKQDPWNSLWEYSGNGDGTLFYPGRTGMFGLKEETPIPSVRVKLWRETSFDAEYLRWMAELKDPPPWWKEEFIGIVQDARHWSADYGRYQRLRNRIGEYLDGRSK